MMTAAAALATAAFFPPAHAEAAPTALHPGTSWDWQIGGTPDPSVLDGATGSQKMLDVDMESTDANQIAGIKSQGIVVVCYIETGSWESYRSDATQFPSSALGNTLNGYPDERYLDINNSKVESLIEARIQGAANKGCDGIEPDLDDTWQANGYDTGFNLSYDSVLAYNHRLADFAHSLGLMFGLKNAGGTQQVADSVSFTDFALNEQCNQYGECNYDPYIAAGKAVFQVEYKLNTSKFCPADNSRNYDGLKKHTSLMPGQRTACRNG
jgi:hypothetical protein